jgi:nucleoside-diphosphate-sugar epimerase
MSKKILVTGASGFIATHTIIDLLNHGYDVRGTIRNLDRGKELRDCLANHNERAADIELMQADLMEPEGWFEAVRGCHGVFHMASPVAAIQPNDEDELIVPARQGTLSVLRAARAHGVTRVVLTSSTSAVSAGNHYQEHLFSEADWTNLDDDSTSAYAKSKTIAERAAWEFVSESDMDLAVINPGMVLGPALETDYGASLEALVKLLRGDVPMLPRIGFEIVDVRDVAALHRIVFENESASGHRFLCTNGFMWLAELAQYLIEQFPDYRKKIPRRELPNFLIRVFALVIREIEGMVGDVGKIKRYDNTPALALGWQPRSAKDAIKAGGESLIKLGIV